MVLQFWKKFFVIVEKLQGRIQEKASGICISTAGMVNTEQGAIFLFGTINSKLYRNAV